MSNQTRPLSPHLQIYRLPLAARLSILHRFTGALLSIGASLLTYWLVALASGPEAYATATGLLGSWIGIPILFLLSFALFYHLCNGIRHLFWDVGLGFDLKTVDLSGSAVILAAGAMTVLAWASALIS
jgi:succinate dehydrogenase / fumarate reductase cytochrome b subunit